MTANRTGIIALLVGIALGAGVNKGLQAQGTPPVYVVVDFTDITDPEGFKALPPKATPASLAPFGGKYVVRTSDITALDGVAPKRFVVISFDSMEKAKAWKASPNTGEIDAIRAKTAKSRQFVVETLP